MMYLAPASTSKRTSSKTSSTTDLNPLAPVPRSRAILAISLIAASVNTKSAPWNRTSFLNCWITAVYPRIAYKAYRRGQKVQAETQQRTQLEGKPL